MCSATSGRPTLDPETEFRRLYEAHRAAVHAYFIGRTGDRQAAADLMQDVFLRAWRHWDSLGGLDDDRQRGWLFTVARNLAIDRARHQRTEAETELALTREPAARAAGPPASTAVLAAERVTVVAQAIGALPESQRVTLAMAAAADLSSAELSAALDLPAGTVRYRLSLARRSLAQALRDYDQSQQEEP